MKAFLPFFPSFPSQNSPREIGGCLFLTGNRERRGVAVHDSGVWIPYNRRVLRDPLSLSSLRREAPYLLACPSTGLDSPSLIGRLPPRARPRRAPINSDLKSLQRCPYLVPMSPYCGIRSEAPTERLALSFGGYRSQIKPDPAS